jgi:hypothetical protein
MIPVTLVVALAFGDGSPESLAAVGRRGPHEERTIKVGQIYIIGQQDVIASFILNQLDFGTGDVATLRQVQEAEHRLGRVGSFVVDPSTGVRPRIRTEQCGGYTNLWIDVVHKQQNVPGP